MISSFSQAIKYLEGFIPEPSTVLKPTQLARPAYLCELLGNPESKYPIIHVGGTSGKGSTATFAATILQELGLKTGLTLSPHLETIRERFQINNQPISEKRFVGLVNDIIPTINQTKDDLGHGYPTYFEIIMVLAFLYFKEEKVDAAVVEVGLGGTLDASNVIPPSTVILTNVSLDHTHILGKTVTKIAKDKMGIIKKGAPAVVSGFSQPILQKMIAKKCQQFRVPLYLLGRDFQAHKNNLRLLGDFQQVNFTLAHEATRHFISTYFPKLQKKFSFAAKSARAKTFIPGRFEIVSHNPLVILDGAHNNAKISALVNAVKQIYPRKKWLIVVAIKKEKTIAGMINRLEPLAEEFIFTSFNFTDTQQHESVNPRELAKLTTKPATVIIDPLQAVKKAQQQAEIDNLPLLITGSLYLLGKVRHFFVK